MDITHLNAWRTNPNFNEHQTITRVTTLLACRVALFLGPSPSPSPRPLGRLARGMYSSKGRRPSPSSSVSPSESGSRRTLGGGCGGNKCHMYEAVQHTHKTSHKHHLQFNHSLVQHLHNQQCALSLVLLVFGEVLFWWKCMHPYMTGFYTFWKIL